MKFRVLIIISLFTTLGVNAQRFTPKSMGTILTYGESIVKGQKPLSGHEYGFSLEMNRYFKSACYLSIGADYRHHTYYYNRDNVPVEVIAARLAYFRTLADIDKTILFYAGIGLKAGYEYLNEGRNTLSDGAELKDKSSFVYGPMATFRIEGYITDNMALIAGGEFPLYIGSSLNLFRPEFQIGLRFNY